MFFRKVRRDDRNFLFSIPCLCKDQCNQVLYFTSVPKEDKLVEITIDWRLHKFCKGVEKNATVFSDKYYVINELLKTSDQPLIKILEKRIIRQVITEVAKKTKEKNPSEKKMLEILKSNKKNDDRRTNTIRNLSSKAKKVFLSLFN
jgi:hypothetical protein